MKQITTTVLDYNEFDQLVRKHLGIKDFECVEAFEWNNDEDHLYTSIKDEAAPETDPEMPNSNAEWFLGELRQVEQYIKDPRPFGTGPHQILQWLCYKGHIEPGNYTIRVSW